VTLVPNKRLTGEQIAALEAEREAAARQLAELEAWAAAQDPPPPGSRKESA
jgi:hypothetical protein